jgi:multidrug efflux pump subunit AcrA (membrane-fusion protein)
MASDIRDAAGFDLEWQDFEVILSEIATLAKSEIDFRRFASELLERTVHMLAAVGGNVWQLQAAGPPRLICRVEADPDCEFDDAQRRRLFDEVVASGDIGIFCGASQNGSRGFGRALQLMAGPLKVDRDVVGVLEIVQRSGLDPSTASGNRRLLSLACEMASDFLRRQELRELRRSQAGDGALDAFAKRVHGTLNLKQVAYELVNEGRQYLCCDRVSLAIRQGRGFRIIAMSGIDTIERRSNAVRQMETFINVIGLTGDEFWYEGEVAELPPQIAEPLTHYLDEANVRQMGLIPLRLAAENSSSGATDTMAVLVVEQFTAGGDESLKQRAARVAEHAAIAVANALRFESLPTLPYARQRKLSAGKPLIGVRGASILIAAACAVIGLMVIPAEFKVAADGKLQPVERREVFAPLDGRVVQLAVRHGDHVAAGAKLLELASPELDVEIQQLQGEYETTRKRYSVVESTLLQSKASKDRDNDDAARLAAEQEELAKLLESQEKKLQLLQREREHLIVRSPIEGEVVTWEIEQLLRDRPVQRGQALLTVANLEGRWSADIEVPDKRIGYVLDAQSGAGQPLRASFHLASNAGRVFRGTVQELAARTDINGDRRPVVNVQLDFDHSALPELRPGATVHAKIACGRKSLGYVWLHDVVEAVRGWWLF